MRHLDMYSGLDKAGNVVSLFGVLVLAALLLIPLRRPARSDADSTHWGKPGGQRKLNSGGRSRTTVQNQRA